MSLKKLENFEEQLDKIKKFLPDYLKELGHDISHGRKIKCLNPEHDDTSPSMSLFEAKEGYPLVRCFSCGFTGDIFNAAHILEHKPLIGPGFIDDTVAYLADKYGIELTYKKLSEEEIFELNMYQAYDAVAQYISKHSQFNEAQLAELAKRGWDEKFARENLIGCCNSYDEMRNYLKSIGFSSKFLEEIDLDNQNIFNKGNIIFTLCDDFGRPVAFMARNLRYDGVRDEDGRLINGPKFINTKSGTLKINIYRRNERLYMLHVAKKQSTFVYIFEGNGDVITAHANGLRNAVGICSVELSDNHLNTLRRNGCYDIVICLDNDDAGVNKAKKILDDVLKRIHDLKVRFVFLPDALDGDGNKKKTDPDEFIREFGVEAFVSLPKIDPFAWRLSQFDSDPESDPEAICLSMIPIIVSEPSSIRRERMIQELSIYTGYSDRVIREELEKINNIDVLRVNAAKQSIIQNLVSALGNGNASPEIMLNNAIDDLYHIDKENNASILDTESRINNILSIKEYQEDEAMISAYDYGANDMTMKSGLDGDMRGKLIFMGAAANVGKTSRMCGVSWEMVENNDNVMAIYLSIDDSAKELTPRILCYDAASRLYDTNRDLFNLININKFATPHVYKDSIEYDALIEQREISFKKLLAHASNDKYIVFDSEDGRTIEFVNTILKNYRDKYPTRDIVIFIDNFHLLSTSGGDKEGREKYKMLSHELKYYAVKYNCTICCSVEYTKLDPTVRPTNNNIAESASLVYDANVIWHGFSELHGMRDKACAYFWSDDGMTKLPIIELDWGKL